MAKHQNPVGTTKSDVVKRLPAACRDEASAVAFLERERWNGEPYCAHCGSVDVYQMKDRDGSRNKRYLWRCKDCGKQYTVRTNTVFSDSPVPLQHWCYAFWAACASKKGVSALQIKRMTGVTYKTALFMMQRIRHAMSDDGFDPTPLEGIVEVDETYCGGRPRNKGIRNRGKVGRATEKTPVLAALQRGGDVRTRPVTAVTAKNLRDFIEGNVSPEATLMTDELIKYRKIGKDFHDHQTVRHSAGEYVRGLAGVNSIESFFAIVKRSLMGTYHSVSKKHLHRYLNERAFVFNARKLDDGARTVLALRKAVGKRLLYKEVTA